MKSKVIFEKNEHKWIILGRDADKSSQIIDTNEYVILHEKASVLLDPGGIEIFPHVLAELTKYVEIENIKTIVASHQDPDIVSSLAMWHDLCPGLKTYCPAIWTGFVAHFGMGTEMDLIGIPDGGMAIPIGDTKASIYAVPAHYCHSSGNFSFYDPIARILFSGDIGAALLPDPDAGLFVENFDEHIPFMEGFHRRWMPSSQALKAWVKRIRAIRPSMICPQHGAIFANENVNKFLDWLDNLPVGSWGEDESDSDFSQSAWMTWNT